MHKISLVSFWIGRLIYEERIKVIIWQAGPHDKTADANKGGGGGGGVGVAKFDFTKRFRNQIFSRVRELYHQYSITNHIERILKSRIMSI